jgi:ankyrin repeat protein
MVYHFRSIARNVPSRSSSPRDNYYELMKCDMIKTCVGASLALASAFLLSASSVPAEVPSLDTGYSAVLRSGDVSKLRAALEHGALANARDAQGNTPLILAAIHGNLESLRLLLDRGADVNATNKAGATALMRAASDYAKAAYLLGRGADVHVRSSFGNTALLLAARPADSHRTVKLLIDRGADAKVTNIFGATALMAAAAGGDEETVRLLLKHGADPNAQSAASEPGFVFGGGRSPLMWAAFRGNEAVIQQLLAAGADVKAGSRLGTPLAQAAWADRTAAAQLLIKSGADVNQAGPADGYTALHWAASTENTDPALVKLLLKYKADPDLGGGAQVDAFMDVLQTPVIRGCDRSTPTRSASDGHASEPRPARTAGDNLVARRDEPRAGAVAGQFTEIQGGVRTPCQQAGLHVLPSTIPADDRHRSGEETKCAGRYRR